MPPQTAAPVITGCHSRHCANRFSFARLHYRWKTPVRIWEAGRLAIAAHAWLMAVIANKTLLSGLFCNCRMFARAG